MYNRLYERFIYKEIPNNNNINNTYLNFFSRKTLNEFFIELRKIEYRTELCDLLENIVNDSRLNKVLSIINMCYFLLLAKDKNSNSSFAEDSMITCYHFFDELYDRNSFYYRALNNKNSLGFNNINVISVVKHNQCVEYVFKKYRTSLPTILTFDSHRDVAGIESKKKLYDYFSSCENETLEANKLLYKNIPFIGSVLYPMIFPYSNNNGIVFIAPKWGNPEIDNSGIFIDRNTNNNNNKFYSNNHEFIDNLPKSNLDYVSYKTYKINTLMENINDGNISDNFILNIDLDYFCTNGDPCTLNINSDITDVMSQKRIIFDYNHIKNEDYKNCSIDNLRVEIDEIRSRVEEFIKLCILLKENGKKPSMIILCDSTELNFSEVNIIDDIGTHIKCSNNFTPKYLILWLKTTVYNHLKHVFG